MMVFIMNQPWEIAASEDGISIITFNVMYNVEEHQRPEGYQTPNQNDHWWITDEPRQ